MISCPYCGTLNRKGSKYCSSCGQRLDVASGIPCPLCDRLNPSDGIVCRFCGAPLVASALAEEYDSGARPLYESRTGPVESESKGPEPAMASRRELPSWLYQQPAARAETLSPPATVLPEEPSAEEEAAASKYLRGIRGVLPGADVWLLASVKRAIGKPTLTS